MKSLILKGGLGNQLFQLSKFIDLQKKGFTDVKLDIKTGFLLDYKYKRKLEFNELNINNYVINNFQTFLNLLIVIFYRIYPSLFNRFSIKIIKDHNLNEIIDNSNDNIIIFNGYFQNFKNVDANIEKIYEIIKPKLILKKSRKFNNLITQIKNSDNSVALGIRFYEESRNPHEHSAKNSSLKRVEDFNKIIRNFEESYDNPVFFLFVQNENDFTRRLKFRSKNYVVSHANGFLGSWERLTAQANCKHHVFNNSTFYYWGAIFSKFLNQNKRIDSEIYISDNFIFDQIYNPEWKRF